MITAATRSTATTLESGAKKSLVLAASQQFLQPGDTPIERLVRIGVIGTGKFRQDLQVVAELERPEAGVQEFFSLGTVGRSPAPQKIGKGQPENPQQCTALPTLAVGG